MARKNIDSEPLTKFEAASHCELAEVLQAS